jgi:hypothetical protein
MRRLVVFPVFGLLALAGCEQSGDDPNGGVPQPEAQKTPADGPAAKDSAWTWAYFFATPDADSVKTLFAGRKFTLNHYRVDKVEAVRGKVGVGLKPEAELFRVECAARLEPPASEKPLLLMHGVPQHLQYTTTAERDDLAKRSRAEVPAGKDTVAVIIPIRKSAEWWKLPHDQRNAHFHKQVGKAGHTAIGAKYVEHIYRKLYHTRYAVEAPEHDFITYFEFDRAHTDEFKQLLAQLRDPELNPEWTYVDREYEIWTTKLE